MSFFSNPQNIQPSATTVNATGTPSLFGPSAGTKPKPKITVGYDSNNPPQNTGGQGTSIFNGQQPTQNNLFSQPNAAAAGGAQGQGQKSAPLNFFGSATTPQPTNNMQSNLFPSATPAGNQPGQPTGVNQTTASSPFGTAPTATNLFGQPQAPQSTPSFMQQPNQNNNNFTYMMGERPMMPNPMMINDEYKDQVEVQQLMNIYKQSIEPSSHKNRFRGYFYNKIPNAESLDTKQTQFYMEYVPQDLNGAPVDLHKFIEAVEQNPDKKKFVPTQVSSTSQLKERAQKMLQDMKKAKNRLEQAKETLNVVQKTCDSQMEQKIKSANERNQIIRTRLSQVFGKLEFYLAQQGRTEVEKRPQQELIAKQQALLRQLCEPHTGLQRQIELIKRQNHDSLTLSEQFRGSDTLDGKVQGQELDKQQIKDADFRDMLRVLQKQKEGIEVLQKSLSQSASQLMVMDRELDLQ